MKNQFSSPPKRWGRTFFSGVRKVSTPAALIFAAAASRSSTYTAMWGMFPSAMETGTGDWINSRVKPPKDTSASSLSPSGVEMDARC